MALRARSPTSGATWTVIGQQVPTFARDMASVNAASRYSVDKWDGYADSRNGCSPIFGTRRSPNPIVLSGDVHTHWCADLKTDFRSRPRPRSASSSRIHR